jgi:hypothetical protein
MLRNTSLTVCLALAALAAGCSNPPLQLQWLTRALPMCKR